jgi:competence protein ComEA
MKGTKLLIVLGLLLTAALTIAANEPRMERGGVLIAAASEPAAATSLVDLNSASKAELEALPGIGEAYSQKIIDGRPYKSKAELVSRKIIPAATYEKIRDKVVARQPKKTK